MYTHVTHEFPPLFDADCSTLVLGSMPSPASRAQGFYYGHPRNRFWRVLSAVLDEPFPETVPLRAKMLLSHRIALWDALEECDIVGASDSSVKNPVPADIPWLLERTRITRVFTTGAAAQKYYMKYNFPRTGIAAVQLPSTSPANCAVSFDALVEAYRALKQ